MRPVNFTDVVVFTVDQRVISRVGNWTTGRCHDHAINPIADRLHLIERIWVVSNLSDR